MKNINDKFQQMISSVPQDIITEIDLSFAIAKEIETLMDEKGLTKKQFAEALGKKPSEITKWLSGQHNFTIRTLAMLSNFFGTPIVRTATRAYTFTEDGHSTMVAEDTIIFGGTMDD